MSDPKQLLAEVESLIPDIDALQILPGLLEKYEEVVYRLTNVASRWSMPRCVVPEELHDPRRVKLTSVIVTEMAKRLRGNIEYESLLTKKGSE